MRKFVKLGICGLMAAMVATGCSKKDTTGTTDPAAATTQGAETQEAGTSEGAAEDSVTLGEYKGVAYTPASVEITDEQVDKEVQKLADSNLVEVDPSGSRGRYCEHRLCRKEGRRSPLMAVPLPDTT